MDLTKLANDTMIRCNEANASAALQRGQCVSSESGVAVGGGSHVQVGGVISKSQLASTHNCQSTSSNNDSQYVAPTALENPARQHPPSGDEEAASCNAVVEMASATTAASPSSPATTSRGRSLSTLRPIQQSKDSFLCNNCRGPEKKSKFQESDKYSLCFVCATLLDESTANCSMCNKLFCMACISRTNSDLFS